MRKPYSPAAEIAQALAGIAARYDATCARCDEGIRPGDRIVFHRGRPIHVRCASGGDDR